MLEVSGLQSPLKNAGLSWRFSLRGCLCRQQQLKARAGLQCREFQAIGQLTHGHIQRRDFQHRQLGVDAADAGQTCQRLAARGHQLRFASLDVVLHHDPGLACAFASEPRTAYDAVEPLLSCWGLQRFYLGADEEARLAKLAVNLLIVGTSTLLAEALAQGQRGGLEWAQLWQLWWVVLASAAAWHFMHVQSARAAGARLHTHLHGGSNAEGRGADPRCGAKPGRCSARG